MDRTEAFRILWQAGAGRDALIAAALVGRDRMGFLLPDDVRAAVRDVDAFIASDEGQARAREQGVPHA